MLINTRTIKRRQIFRRAPPDHSLCERVVRRRLFWLCHCSRRRARTMYTPRHFAFQTGFDNDEDAAVENKAANLAPAVRAPLAASNPRRFPRVYSISCPAESALLRLYCTFSTLLCRMNLLVSFSRRTLFLSPFRNNNTLAAPDNFSLFNMRQQRRWQFSGRIKARAHSTLKYYYMRRVKLLFYICAAPEKVLISIKFNLEGA